MAKRRESSVRAEAEFRACVADLGGTITGAYARTKCPVTVRCPAGHLNEVWPMAVLRGNGICLTCVYGGWKVAPEAAFRQRVEALGGAVVGEYATSLKPVLVTCSAAHENGVRPADVRKGRGICWTCADRDPAKAEAAFLTRMALMGATALGPYVNAHTGVPALCAAGHSVFARPHDVRKGLGICRVCAGQDPATAEAIFHARLAELGAVSLETQWTGASRPHRIRCAAGHASSPIPANVMSGQGICRTCAGMAWDAFYVVSHAVGHRVKFGITSGDPRPRLRTHRRYGYSEIVLLRTGLAGTLAPDAENAVKAALRDAGEKPVRGMEYFDISCLALILDVATHWLAETERRAS
ncbi:MAG: hypothetical protein ACLQFR_17330 [Streptosporangiaceae bacterium]